LALIGPLLAANILISPSWLSPVHRFTMRHLAAELLRRNHSVTWLVNQIFTIKIYSSNEIGLERTFSLEISILLFMKTFLIF
jgi:hypothetical protein